MSDDRQRPPRAFDTTPASPAPPRPARAPRAVTDLSMVQLDPEEALELEMLESSATGTLQAPARRRRLTFGKVFFAGLGLVVSMSVGLALDSLVRDFFARADWLGYAAMVASAVLVIGAVGVALRELRGLMKLRQVETERREARQAYDSNDETAARHVISRLSSMLSGRAETFAGRQRLNALENEVIDGRDRIVLAERELLQPLDLRARALVLGSAKRVSVVTAVSPRALVDLAFVFYETVRLIRRISELYGARPGTIGLARLTRDVLTHLAVTGSIAVGDGLVQQVVGHGLAQKLSAKLGEGVVNGLLTARVGLAAMDLCRPMPFLSIQRPGMGSMFRDLSAVLNERTERND
ncbi:TIGR01620 family protein [Aureimonas fodinaquatilis]|uniref:UPF0283 membrane protein FPY71_06000 n=1 Tax=Aureimonas fodinaquatilis TaxID=2565783 RepID=A0A5B0E0M1_9HYPH|nr:TIGR01620 family protein [Aureimonas fodinaquatilis]KAA0972624.1 TIGR01620 family protein [Aureimonas fodinaquatilis]